MSVVGVNRDDKQFFGLAKANAIAKQLYKQVNREWDGKSKEDQDFRDSLLTRWPLWAEYLVKTKKIPEDATLFVYREEKRLGMRTPIATIKPSDRTNQLHYTEAYKTKEELAAGRSETGAVAPAPLVSVPTPPSPAVKSVASEVGSVGASEPVVKKAPEPRHSIYALTYPYDYDDEIKTTTIQGKKYKYIYIRPDTRGMPYLYDDVTDKFVGTITKIGGLQVVPSDPPALYGDEPDSEDEDKGTDSGSVSLAVVEALKQKWRERTERIRGEREAEEAKEKARGAAEKAERDELARKERERRMELKRLFPTPIAQPIERPAPSSPKATDDEVPTKVFDGVRFYRAKVGKLYIWIDPETDQIRDFITGKPKGKLQAPFKRMISFPSVEDDPL